MRWSSIIAWQCTRRVVPSLNADNGADWQPSPANIEFNYRSGSCVWRRGATASLTNFPRPGRGRVGCFSKSAALIPSVLSSPSRSLRRSRSHSQRTHQRRWLKLPWHSGLPVHAGISPYRHIGPYLSTGPPVVWNDTRLCPWVLWTSSAAVQHCQHKGSYLLCFFTQK